MITTLTSRQLHHLLLNLFVHVFLLTIQLSLSLVTYRNETFVPSSPSPAPCRPNQAFTLVQLGRSFSTTNDSTCTLAPWRASSDCCSWAGVTCAAADGRVTGLDLGGCGLESAGGLHPALFNLTSLRYLDLSGNSFGESELPAVGFERLTELTHLDLSYTDFIGKIPRGIRRLIKLEYLDFSNWIYLVEGDNDYFLPLGEGRWAVVEPDIGALVANLSNLKVLNLGNVDLSGNGAAWCDAFANSTPRLQFTTAITYKRSDVSFSKILRTIVVIDVSDNALYGAISQSIGDLILLGAINMSHNALTGPIPSQLGMLHQLESLDLSSNGLSGEIPQELASLDFLSILNLSNNKLEGRIPESPHFSTFSNLSFLGNIGLCGLEVSKACNNMSADVIPHQSKVSIDIVLFLFAGLGFGVGFAIAIVLTGKTSMCSSLAFRSATGRYQDSALSSTRPATPGPIQLQNLESNHTGSDRSPTDSDRRCPRASKPLDSESSSTEICVSISSF
ncbi:hypothetical protein HU200_055605 [Digitaria exilis]|uniref:Leucine-rich repeat-containing N-terminal plant-type domain-containing protein n=1 Tax=Digitaria exilis TaxID=1010633 RepID=A0A835E6H2_9POAL|nr:hypothetical protein HU200_055605 [Digitaria exilis]